MPSGPCDGFFATMYGQQTSRCITVSELRQFLKRRRPRMPLADLIRCERCAVGIRPACAIGYSDWSGGPGKPGRLYGKLVILRMGSLLCCKCFDDYLPYAPDDDPGDTACSGL